MDVLAAQDKDSFETAVGLYKDMVYGIALSHTKSRTDADDVFQEVFMAYWRKKPAFNGEEHRKAWLIKTAINCSKRVLAANWKRLLRVEDTSIQTFEFETEEQNLIFTEMCKLPMKYRTALHLFYFEDMSVKEISGALGVNPGTVRVHLSRGRELMRQSLKGEYFNG